MVGSVHVLGSRGGFSFGSFQTCDRPKHGRSLHHGSWSSPRSLPQDQWLPLIVPRTTTLAPEVGGLGLLEALQEQLLEGVPRNRALSCWPTPHPTPPSPPAASFLVHIKGFSTHQHIRHHSASQEALAFRCVCLEIICGSNRGRASLGDFLFQCRWTG